MIGIIDYGRGNLFSLTSALEYLGYKYVLILNAEELSQDFEKVILPGVGAFGDAMLQLKKKKFIEKIKMTKTKNIPILGICLGMQLFATKSYEFSENNGLNFIPGEVKKIFNEGNFRIPNVGWRTLKGEYSKEKKIFNFDKMMYFVHSYAYIPKHTQSIKSYITLGNVDIPAIVQKDNVIGFQFHPERSGEHGLVLLKWFLECFNK